MHIYAQSRYSREQNVSLSVKRVNCDKTKAAIEIEKVQL